MSIKRIYLARRNPAISMEDFPRQWRRHAALAASFSNVNRRYTRVAQCTQFNEPRSPYVPRNDYAGVALLWMESLEVALEVTDDRDIIERLRPDEVRVFGAEVVHSAMFAQEHVLRDGPATGIVVIEFLARLVSTTPQAFTKHWRHHHAKRLLLNPAVDQRVRRYTQNLVVRTPPPGYEFDGISEMWFDNEQDAIATLNDPDYRANVEADRAGFCEIARTVTLPTRVTHAWSVP